MNTELEHHLHTINNFAGFYKSQQRNANSDIKCIKAKERKEALYRIKHTLIQTHLSESTNIEKHNVNGKLFYCIYFTEYSFHIPIHKLSISQDVPTKTLDSFEKTTQVSDITTLYNTFKYLESNCDINPNEYLSKEIMMYDNSSVVLLWSY